MFNSPSERFFPQLLDALGKLVIATDLEGKIGYWNQAVEALYQWRADKEMGKHTTEANAAIQRQNTIFNALNRLFRESIPCESSQEAAQICLSVAIQVTGSDYGSVAEVNKNGRFDTLALSEMGWEACQINPLDPACIQNMEIRGIWKAALESERGLLINDPLQHPKSVGVPEGHPPLTSFLGMPFQHKAFTGMIGIANKQGGYTESDREIIEALAYAFAEVINSKRAEETLRESETKNKAILNATPDLMFLLSQDGVHLDIFAPNLQQLFVSPEDLLGKNVADVFPQEVSKKYNYHIKKAIASDAIQIFEYALEFDDSSVHYYESRLVTSGEETVLAIVREITDQKIALEELKIKMAEIKSINEMYVGREGRMIDLKREVNELLKEAGQPPKYVSPGQVNELFSQDQS